MKCKIIIYEVSEDKKQEEILVQTLNFEPADIQRIIVAVNNIKVAEEKKPEEKK